MLPIYVALHKKSTKILHCNIGAPRAQSLPINDHHYAQFGRHLNKLATARR